MFGFSLPLFSFSFVSLSLTRCLFLFFLFVLVSLPGPLDLGRLSALLAAQLVSFTALLLEGFFVRRLQRAIGSNTGSMDMVVFLVKTPGFSIHMDISESLGISPP